MGHLCEICERLGIRTHGSIETTIQGEALGSTRLGWVCKECNNQIEASKTSQFSNGVEDVDR